MCVVNDNLIIHGGLDIKDKPLKDMYSINIVKLINNQNPTWIQVNYDIGPLHSHLMVSNHNKLYFFGGDKLYRKGKGSKSRNNHLVVFDLKYCETQKDTEINKIKPRSGHNGCVINLKNTDYIFVFGGTGEYSYCDTFLINIQERINNNDNNEQKLDNNTQQKYNKMCQEYELKIKKILQENENLVSQLIQTNQALTTQHQSTMKSIKIEIKSLSQNNSLQSIKIAELETINNDYGDTIQSLSKRNNETQKQIKKYQNDIKLLKQNIDDLMRTNQEEATKSETIKNAYENKIQSLSKQINNQQKSEQKQDDNFNRKEELFRKYFLKTFDSMKSNKIYYNNLVDNDLNSIDTFILIENMDDINGYIKPKNKIHANLLLKRINKIKKDRNIFESKLDRINMSDYLDVFDLYGIYTLNEYNNKIKTINDLKNILNNNKDSELIFNSINNDNEGQLT